MDIDSVVQSSDEDSEEYTEEKQQNKDDTHSADSDDGLSRPPKHLTGLTVAEAKKFLFDYGARHPWRWSMCRHGCDCNSQCVRCGVSGWSWLTAGLSWILFVVGSPLSGIYCTNSGWINNCNSLLHFRVYRGL